MSQLLAIISSAFYGVADFSGGLASRSVAVWRVTAWSQLIGVSLLLVGLAVIDAPEVTRQDLMWGTIGGLFGLLGVAMLYTALAAGTMSVVSPITGVLAAIFPIVWGLASGETIVVAQWLGIALAIIAVVLITRTHSETRITGTVLAQAIAAAVGFGLFFIALGQTSEASGLWPLAAARGASIPAAFIVAGLLRNARFPPAGVLPIIAFAGFTDMAANLAGLLALQMGPLGINSVLMSLYPAFTVLAAIIVIRERPTTTQKLGIGAALIAAVILAL
ncbi:MAG: EamA family transporter [Proteobacteria bacterium]|nr:EamA family transporter [Pseudomonadota bacterium]